ncbi:hypothetical protein DFH07DRAFT_964101 [Mycena maculata]|uniref:MIF4G domain-containing protein n=1 Tax=Mycena maculata TaxID=230809 RepID=A0AAD7IK88_9AGAR|nr:hypothetical protein DFH07DRAFT_964101 [Mycena maculata]
MPCPNTPDTPHPIFATEPNYYDNSPTPRVSNFPPQYIRDRRSRELPRHTSDLGHLWSSVPSINLPPLLGVYDDGQPVRRLNARANEFRPLALGSRPASALSVSSRSSSASATSSSMAYASLDTPATSVSGGRASKSAASPSRRSPLPPAHPVPVFPEVDPAERTYKLYRDRLRTASDLTEPIKCIIEAGVLSYELTQHIAILADRLSTHAPCGPQEFKARIRTEALAMFSSYWESNAGPWCHEPKAPHEYLTSRGINIAAFIGSLYRYKIVSGRDAHRCLDILLSTGLHCLKLQAVHAMFVHCGQRICTGDAGLDTTHVWTRLSARSPDGRFVWGPIAESHALLEDLRDNLDRWFASEEMSRIHARAAALSPPSATNRNRGAYVL